MKPTGFIKNIDEVGRIVIPKPVRKTINVELGDSLQFFIEDDCIILKKLSTTCTFCGSEKELRCLNEKYVCAECIAKLTVTEEE